MKRTHFFQSIIFFLFLGFFAFVPFSKAFALDVPTPPTFPSAISTVYDDKVNSTMTANALVYGGNTNKYWFAYTFHEDASLRLKLVQARTHSHDVGMYTATSPYGTTNLRGMMVYVYYDGSWQYLMDRYVTNDYGVTYSSLWSTLASTLGCDNTDYYTNICISSDYALSDSVLSTVDLYWFLSYTPEFPTAFDSYPATSGDSIVGVGSLGSIPSGESAYQNTSPYYIKWSNKALESDNPCILDIATNPSNTTQWLVCDGYTAMFEVNPTNGTKTPLYDFPILTTPDAPTNYCTDIKESNYILKDSEGNQLCNVLSPSYLRNMIAPYQDPIDTEAIEAEDWGIGEWFKTPFLWFVNIINTIAEWGYDLYYKFLTFIVPNPDIFAYYFNTLKSQMTAKIENIDLSSLEAFKDIGASEMPDIKVTLMGTEMTILNFDLLKDNIGIIQPIAIASIGLFLLLFNINQINKLLTDTEVTA